ncbi:sensor histidine kinase [Microbacterium sp. P07]|uniref:sensor histidine kinase n=1 Tax=Microbacterium sp. P07 TaxID=3366952 RepID=UPI00374766B8
MPRGRTRTVVGAASGSDDGLLLPHQPGVIRRFWAQHPRFTDVLVALSAVLLSVPAAVLRSPYPVPPAAGQIWFAVGLALVACAALMFRRERPLTVFAITAAPLLLLPASLVPTFHILPAYALYAIAAYRSTRAAWIAFGVAASAVVGHTLLTVAVAPAETGLVVSSAIFPGVTLLIGTLIGINVGNRRRYLEALIDRSRQLLVERDQQSRLAAAAERTRIAREMHDIVSHSLTVIVALTEGAAAASDPERARIASRGAADTARAALTEMRSMLGVLRDDSADTTPLEPLEPSDPAQVVAAAQRAGFPVTASFTGSTVDAPPAVRFALGRIVQESVTNAMRHAPGATDIRVTVSAERESVVVTVENDGASPRESDAPGGFGLRGLEERTEHVGGTLVAGPIGANTWRLRATLPLHHPRPEEPS